MKLKFGKKETVWMLVFTALIALLWFMPTGFARRSICELRGARARVLEVDNSGVYANGIIRQGDQGCTVEILSGAHRGATAEAINLLVGKMDLDKLFETGGHGMGHHRKRRGRQHLLCEHGRALPRGKELLLIGCSPRSSSSFPASPASGRCCLFSSRCWRSGS
jgi:hypothetical protein